MSILSVCEKSWYEYCYDHMHVMSRNEEKKEIACYLFYYFLVCLVWCSAGYLYLYSRTEYSISFALYFVNVKYQ